MRKIFTLVSICFIVLIKPLPVSAQVDVQDSLALVDLYNSTDGPHWTQNSNWLNGPVINWFGIALDFQNENKKIYEIYLPNNNLKGSLPVSLGNLNRLYDLELDNNQLSGDIPSSLGNLGNLRNFSIHNNQLSGSIPSSLGSLHADFVDLQNNQLSGNIPISLGNLDNISALRLANNKLEGNIPASLGNLAKLDRLFLNNNQLTGSIPSSVGNLTRMYELDFSHNQLTGAIPASLENLSTMQALRLNNNQLNGSIPSTLGTLPLAEVNLSNNQLTGSIPSSISNVSNLYKLDLSHNQLSGTIPASFEQVRFTLLFLDFNQLTGIIPNIRRSSSTGRDTFKFNNNRFTISAFESLRHYPNLYYLLFPQHKIALHRKENILSVSAGGTLRHNKYRWHKDGMPDTTIDGDSTFELKEPGVYSVTVVNTKVPGFELYSIRDTVIAVRDEGRLAASNYNKQLIIYPNPAKGTMNINLPKATANSYVLLYSMDGKQILKQSVTSSQLHINISGITAGNYELVLAEENKIKYTYPVVITR